jgi:hypothetical protein
MVKRYCLFVTNGVRLEAVACGWQGSPLFKTERQALKYINSSDRYQMAAILPVFVTKEIAAKQTIVEDIS